MTEAISPSNQPTRNDSTMTWSLPLLPTAIESNLIPPPTLPDGTSYPSSTPVVSHSSLPLSSFLLVRDGSSDRNMLDEQQLQSQLQLYGRPKCKGAGMVLALALELLWPFSFPKERNGFPFFGHSCCPDLPPLSPGVPEQVIWCVFYPN